MANVSTITSYIKSNLGLIGSGIGGATIGGALGFAAGKSFGSKKKKRKASNKTRKARYRSGSSRKKGKRYTPHTAGKRKDTSRRRIRQTKNGQPYIILANGRARFISKKSAKTSRRRSGGRY